MYETMDTEQVTPAEAGGGGDAAILECPQEGTSALDRDARSPEAVEHNANHEFVNVLKDVDLVTEKIVSFLNLEDMKSLRAVCLGSMQAVRKTKDFLSKAQFIVGASTPMYLLEEPLCNWGQLSIDLSIPIELLQLIHDILPSVNSLSLKLRLGATPDNTVVVNYLSEIFKCTPHLKKLELDGRVLTYILHDVFSDVTAQSVLSQLDHLDIKSSMDNPSSIYYINDDYESGDEENAPFQRNFLQLSMIPLKLKSFSFGKIMNIDDSGKHHVKFIPRIVEATKDSLKNLELHLCVWKLEEMESIRCPNLKRLVISVSEEEKDISIVSKFLRGQPPLTELVLVVNEKLPVSTLQVIEGMKSKLMKLHLKAKSFSGSTSPMDWKFLRTLTKLKDFHIKKPFSFNSGYELYGYGEDFMRNLPETVEKISLQGFDEFWRDDLRDISELTSRFTKITELNFLRSSDALTDDGLQTIITTCKSLTSLTFSHCHAVTNAGLSGIRRNEDGTEEAYGASLKELKGLVRFKIRSCPNVTHQCLLDVVQFEHLRFFDYFRNVHLEKDFLLQILRQNPCLEEVVLHMRTYDNDVDYKAELKKEAKGVRPRLSKLEILEDTDWEDEDSDSDASKRSDDEDEDSDFSGGAYRYHDYSDFDDYDDSPDDFFDGPAHRYGVEDEDDSDFDYE